METPECFSHRQRFGFVSSGKDRLPVITSCFKEDLCLVSQIF